MRKIKQLLLILSISAFLFACAKSEMKTIPAINEMPPSENGQIKTPTNFPVGNYQYSGYNKKGEKIIEGRLSITSCEKERVEKGFVNRIKGHWDLKAVRQEPLIGDQLGSGDLSGQIDGNLIYINLNPSVNDGNVILEGQIDEQGLRGKWRAVGYAGTVNEGSFDGKSAE